MTEASKALKQALNTAATPHERYEAFVRWHKATIAEGDRIIASLTQAEGVEAVCTQCGHYVPHNDRIRPTMHIKCYDDFNR